jgi:hypothetical protein
LPSELVTTAVSKLSFQTLKIGTAHLCNKDEKHGGKGCRAVFLSRNSELRPSESASLARADVTRQKKQRNIRRLPEAVVNKHQSSSGTIFNVDERK